MTKLAPSIPTQRNRIQSIDILRGIVMVIMALDHVRDFFHKADVSNGAAVAIDPTNPSTTTPLLFFTRWITHFCAPTFIFLAGTSIFLMGQKKSKKDLSWFLIKRGLWLVLVEVLIITFGWRFDPLYHLFFLQVIWAIGISMIIVGLLIYFPWQVLLALGLLIFFAHNLMDYPGISTGLKGTVFADFAYFANFSFVSLGSGRGAIIVYAFLPWTGLMLLGYCFGKLFTQGFDAAKRKKILFALGGGLILLFIVLRYINHYGDPYGWEQQPRGGFYTFLSFLNVNKYPPSLDFLSVTIGVAMIALALLEGIQNKITGVFRTYGRVPMFYYILHFYIIHLIGVIVFFAQGFPLSQVDAPGSLFYFRPDGFGFGLAGVYAVWITVVLILYPLCKKYDRYKSTHQQWWLSYL
jgi:uncharacterized membrane protein